MKVLKSTVAFLLSYSLFFAFTIALSNAKKDADLKNIREPAVAGGFYTDDAKELKKQVLGFLDKSPNLGLSERIKAILTPHAGYQFSGQIAALAYKQIASRKLDTVILLGPSHRTPFSTISVYAEGAFRTSLGLVEIDSEAAKKLIEQHKNIEYYPGVHIPEHSLEVQLPFILREEFYEKVNRYHHWEALEALGVSIGIFYAAGGDPRTAIIGAANYGRDVDSIAGIVGAIAGAFGGIDLLPADWVWTVREANPETDIKELARSLCEILVKKLEKERTHAQYLERLLD